MREPREAANLAELYDEDPMPWSRVNDAIGSGSIPPEVPCFLGTVRRDGRPHAAGVGVAHYDGDLYFTSGPGTRKSRNLSANPACTLSLRLEGVDVVFEGEARRVTDQQTLVRVASVFRDGGGRPKPMATRSPRPTAHKAPVRHHGTSIGLHREPRLAWGYGRPTAPAGGASEPGAKDRPCRTSIEREAAYIANCGRHDPFVLGDELIDDLAQQHDDLRRRRIGRHSHVESQKAISRALVALFDDA